VCCFRAGNHHPAVKQLPIDLVETLLTLSPMRLSELKVVQVTASGEWVIVWELKGAVAAIV
jgi:hypothetical protein